ncbi:MAG: hypothetical protein KGD63_07540 [Candidatus Lokiarchaeota archaeon]|nr:hypothetical protein [Candidatus Lokiarchaeota archaeon]
MVEIKKIFSNCPLCNKTMSIEIEKDLVLNSKKHLNPFVIEHCEKTILIHIDGNFKVRGTQVVFNAIITNKTDIN